MLGLAENDLKVQTRQLIRKRKKFYKIVNYSFHN
jgi:hypothetical protein